MNKQLSLKDLSMDELYEIFEKSFIRTRVTFEQAIYNMGGNRILFSSETLEKREEIEDVIGYLNNWSDYIIVRFHDIKLIYRMADYGNCPVINALSDINHPCEVITDLYSLYKKNINVFSSRFFICWSESKYRNGMERSKRCLWYFIYPVLSKGV